MSPSRVGLITAIVTLVIDQASKLGLYLSTDLALTQPWPIGPFMDFVVLWNHGVSYGLFQQDSEAGRWFLVGLSILASIGLAYWMSRAGTKLLSASLGLIVGGAIGNVIDRIAFGAVLDFIHLHAGSWSWYVFNIADAAIVAGVVGLILDSLVSARNEAQASGPKH